MSPPTCDLPSLSGFPPLFSSLISNSSRKPFLLQAPYPIHPGSSYPKQSKDTSTSTALPTGTGPCFTNPCDNRASCLSAPTLWSLVFFMKVEAQWLLQGESIPQCHSQCWSLSPSQGARTEGNRAGSRRAEEALVSGSGSFSRFKISKQRALSRLTFTMLSDSTSLVLGQRQG